MYGASLIVLASTFAASLAATADEWRSRSIYQIVTDRFALGNGTTPYCDTSKRVYCGGNWQGIIGKLDYIQGMGFDAVWISPVVTNINETVDGEAYHGYWTGDFDTMNKNFGTPQDLKDLSAALHSREMYLMVDINVNHMAANSTPANLTWLSTFNNDTDFHPQQFVQNWNDQNQLEQSWLMDGNVILPDLNTEFVNVTTKLNSWIRDLTNMYGIDGLRLHVANYVRKDFWPQFSNSSGVFTLAEVVTNDTDYASTYAGVLDSVLDYPTFYALQDAFSSPSGNLSNLAQVATRSQSKYKSGLFSTGSFLENHDNTRMQARTQDQSLVMNAMAWNFAADGMPIVYYGQEQGFQGAKNPDNREPLWPSGYNTNKPLVQFIAALNAARRAASIASPSFHNEMMRVSELSSNTLAISKAPLLALLTNGGNSSTVSWNVTDSGYMAYERLVDVVSCNVIAADSAGGVNARSHGGLPIVLLPEDALLGSGLCGKEAGFKVQSAGNSGSSTRTISRIATLLAILSAALLFH